MSGRIKTIKPQFNSQGRTVDACAQAKCAYCGRYGALGSCDGCGAPNQPVVLTDPGPLGPRIEVTAFGDCKRRFVAGLTELPLGTVIR